MNKRKLLNAVIIVTVLAVAATLSASFLHNRPTYMSDTVTYVEGARSLAQGEGYFRSGNPITTWPPGYSIFLSGLVRCGADSFVAFKSLNIFFALLAMGFLLALFRRFLTIWEASALALATGVFFPWIYYTHTILADIPFTTIVAGFLLSTTLYASQTTDQRPQTTDRSLRSTLYALRWLIASSLLCAIAPLTRSAGVALIPALAFVIFVTFCWFSPPRFRVFRALPLRCLQVFGQLAFGLRRGSLLVLLPAALTLTAWFLRNHQHTGSILGYAVGVTPGYAASLEKIGITDPSLFTRIWINIRGYTHVFVIPDQVGIARIGKLHILIHVACIAMWALMAMGWVRRLLDRRTWSLSVTFACYAGLLLLNTWYDIRYVLPVLGLCFLFLYDGITICIALFLRAVTVIPWPLGSRFPFQLSAFNFQLFLRFAFLALLVAGNLAFSVMGPQAATLRSPEYKGSVQRLYKACQSISASDKEGDVLVAGGPGFVPAWTGRKVSSLLGQVNRGRAVDDLSIPAGVRYLIMSESTFSNYREMYMAPIVERNRERLGLTFESGETRVFEIQEDDEHI